MFGGLECVGAGCLDAGVLNCRSLCGRQARYQDYNAPRGSIYLSTSFSRLKLAGLHFLYIGIPDFYEVLATLIRRLSRTRRYRRTHMGDRWRKNYFRGERPHRDFVRAPENPKKSVFSRLGPIGFFPEQMQRIRRAARHVPSNPASNCTSQKVSSPVDMSFFWA